MAEINEYQKESLKRSGRFTTLSDKKHFSEKDASAYLGLIADTLEYYACQEERDNGGLSIIAFNLREMAEPFKNYEDDLHNDFTCDNALSNFTNALGLTSGHARTKSIPHEIYNKVNSLLFYEYKFLDPFQIYDGGPTLSEFLCNEGPESYKGLLPDVYSCRKPLSKIEAIKTVAKKEGVSISNVKKSFYMFYEFMNKNDFENKKRDYIELLHDSKTCESIILEFKNNTDFSTYQKNKSHLMNEYHVALSKKNADD